MASFLKKIQSINQMDKDIVLGYTRRAEKLVHSNQIPEQISFLCLLYFHEFDCFIKCGYTLEINGERDTIRSTTTSQKLSSVDEITAHGLVEFDFKRITAAGKGSTCKEFSYPFLLINKSANL